MKEETRLQHMVMEELSAKGYIPIRMNVGNYLTHDLRTIKIGIVGTPDLLILNKNCKCFWIELKTEKGILSKEQIKFHNFLKSIGHHVYIVRNIKELESIYEKEK